MDNCTVPSSRGIPVFPQTISKMCFCKKIAITYLNLKLKAIYNKKTNIIEIS
jgi:hypothetical protein